MNDWAVLDRTDPAPGDPAATRALGERMLGQAQTVDTSTGRLRSVAAGTGELQMAGDYAASYGEALQTLPGDLDKLSRAYHGCSTSLTAFAASLEEAKHRAGAALTQGRDADSRYRTAIREIRTLLPPAQQMLVGNGLALHSTAIEAATMGLDEATRAQVRAAAGRARNADADLDRAGALADDAAELRGSAEERCAKGIDDALDDNGRENKPLYKKALDAVSAPFRSWDDFVDLCKNVALVAGVAAMFISGPIGWALVMATALVAGAAIFANDLSKYARGQVGLGTLAFDALGLIPGGRGVVSVTKLGRQAGALGRELIGPGGAKVLAGAIGRQMRNTLYSAAARIEDHRGDAWSHQGPALVRPGVQVPVRGTGSDRSRQRRNGSANDGLRASWPAPARPAAYVRVLVRRWPVVRSVVEQLPGSATRGRRARRLLRLHRSGDPDLPATCPRGERPARRGSAAPTLAQCARRLRRRGSGDRPPHVLRRTPAGTAGRRGRRRPSAGLGDRGPQRQPDGIRYDSLDGALAQIRHSGGYVLDAQMPGGLVTAFTLRGSDGRPDTTVVRYGYDEAEPAHRRRQLLGPAVAVQLRLENRITSWEDRIGTWYRYTYDGEGRVVRTSGSAHCLDGEIRYDRENRVTVEVNSLGAQTVYHFNEACQVERVVDPLGFTTVHEWDRYDRKLSETDPLGRTTRYAYDDWERGRGDPPRRVRRVASTMTCGCRSR